MYTPDISLTKWMFFTTSSDSQNKKKKSKPFQKLRKFFRGSSKKRGFKTEGGEATLKSHSVSALHTKEVEDDDDGG